MSVTSRPKRMSAPELRTRKGGEPIVALTAYTAIHERTEAAWSLYLDIGKQIYVTPATTLAGLAARLRVLASISTEGSVPSDVFVVSIADDAARLAGGAA